MPKLVIWCSGIPSQSPVGHVNQAFPQRKGFLVAMTGKPPEPIVVDDPEAGMSLVDVKGAQAMLDLVGQEHARILAVLN